MMRDACKHLTNAQTKMIAAMPQSDAPASILDDLDAAAVKARQAADRNDYYETFASTLEDIADEAHGGTLSVIGIQVSMDDCRKWGAA
jgi:hypothetical protein